MNKEKLTIEKILKANFQRSPQSSSFNLFMSKEPLTLVVVDRYDKNEAYVTDGVHTIFTIMANKEELLKYYHFHRSKDFGKDRCYIYAPRTYAWATFKDITQPPSNLERHPYTPHYYLKEKYNEFINDRKVYKIKAPAERIVIFEWNLALVNIGSSGYYAPVIAIRKFRLEKQSNPPPYMDLSCVLYEKWLQQKMEAYRINDIRREKQQKFPVIYQISMFYFMRNTKKVNSMEKRSSMATVDNEQLLLKHDPKLVMHYVIIGNLTGTISFPNSLKSEINEARIDEMSLQNFSSLFNGLSLTDYESQKQAEKKPVSLWSSESESDNEDRQEESITMENQQMEEESEQDEGEDPLKNLYLKQLRGRNTKAE